MENKKRQVFNPDGTPLLIKGLPVFEMERPEGEPCLENFRFIGWKEFASKYGISVVPSHVRDKSLNHWGLKMTNKQIMSHPRVKLVQAIFARIKRSHGIWVKSEGKRGRAALCMAIDDIIKECGILVFRDLESLKEHAKGGIKSLALVISCESYDEKAGYDSVCDRCVYLGSKSVIEIETYIVNFICYKVSEEVAMSN